MHAIAPASRPPAVSSEQHRLGVQREANGLLHELKNWDTAYTFVPLHPRTQYGNHAYWHALRLRLLREVFRVPKDDERITNAVSAIMEISKEMLALYGRIVWYVSHFSFADVISRIDVEQDDMANLDSRVQHACRRSVPLSRPGVPLRIRVSIPFGSLTL